MANSSIEKPDTVLNISGTKSLSSFFLIENVDDLGNGFCVVKFRTENKISIVQY